MRALQAGSMATDFFDFSHNGPLDRSSLPADSSSLGDSAVLPIPPAHSGTLLLPLCLPSIALGMVAVLVGTWLFHAPSASLLTFAGCLAGLLATIALFRRQEAAAVAMLNRPDM